MTKRKKPATTDEGVAHRIFDRQFAARRLMRTASPTAPRQCLKAFPRWTPTSKENQTRTHLKNEMRSSFLPSGAQPRPKRMNLLGPYPRFRGPIPETFVFEMSSRRSAVNGPRDFVSACDVSAETHILYTTYIPQKTPKIATNTPPMTLQRRGAPVMGSIGLPTIASHVPISSVAGVRNSALTKYLPWSISVHRLKAPSNVPSKNMKRPSPLGLRAAQT